MNVFKLWKTSPYTFMVVQNTALGSEVVEEFDTTGVVKLRDQMQQDQNMEYRQSDSTIYVRPNEAFIEQVGGSLIGHGIRVAKDNYDAREFRIVSQSKGDDMRGKIGFYRIKIRPEVFVYEQSS